MSISFIKKISLVVCSILMLASCTSDKASCYADNIGAYITEVSGSAEITATVNQKITFDVTFQLDTTCGRFQDFNTQTTDKESVVTVAAIYEGCTCKNEKVIDIQTYTFTATTPGVYKLNFKISSTAYITKIITVS